VYHGTGSGLTGVEGQEPVPAALMLGRGAPNPFGASVQLRYTLPERGNVRLVVYDVAGRGVAMLKDSEEEAGTHVVRWDGRGLRGTKLVSGVYFVRLTFGEHEESVR